MQGGDFLEEDEVFTLAQFIGLVSLCVPQEVFRIHETSVKEWFLKDDIPSKTVHWELNKRGKMTFRHLFSNFDRIPPLLDTEVLKAVLDAKIDDTPQVPGMPPVLVTPVKENLDMDIWEPPQDDACEYPGFAKVHGDFSPLLTSMFIDMGVMVSTLEEEDGRIWPYLVRRPICGPGVNFRDLSSLDRLLGPAETWPSQSRERKLLPACYNGLGSRPNKISMDTITSVVYVIEGDVAPSRDDGRVVTMDLLGWNTVDGYSFSGSVVGCVVEDHLLQLLRKLNICETMPECVGGNQGANGLRLFHYLLQTLNERFHGLATREDRYALLKTLVMAYVGTTNPVYVTSILSTWLRMSDGDLDNNVHLLSVLILQRITQVRLSPVAGLGRMGAIRLASLNMFPWSSVEKAGAENWLRCFSTWLYEVGGVKIIKKIMTHDSTGKTKPVKETFLEPSTDWKYLSHNVGQTFMAPLTTETESWVTKTDAGAYLWTDKVTFQCVRFSEALQRATDLSVRIGFRDYLIGVFDHMAKGGIFLQPENMDKEKYKPTELASSRVWTELGQIHVKRMITACTETTPTFLTNALLYKPDPRLKNEEQMTLQYLGRFDEERQRNKFQPLVFHRFLTTVKDLRLKYQKNAKLLSFVMLMLNNFAIDLYAEDNQAPQVSQGHLARMRKLISGQGYERGEQRWWEIGWESHVAIDKKGKWKWHVSSAKEGSMKPSKPLADRWEREFLEDSLADYSVKTFIFNDKEEAEKKQFVLFDRCMTSPLRALTEVMMTILELNSKGQKNKDRIRKRVGDMMSLLILRMYGRWGRNLPIDKAYKRGLWGGRFFGMKDKDGDPVKEFLTNIPMVVAFVIFLLGAAYNISPAPVRFMSLERLVKRKRMSERGVAADGAYGEDAMGMETKERKLFCQDWSSFERGPDGTISDIVDDFQLKVVLEDLKSTDMEDEIDLLVFLEHVLVGVAEGCVYDKRVPVRVWGVGFNFEKAQVLTEAKLAWTTEPPAQLNEIFGKDWQKKFSQAVDQAAREMGSMEVFLDFCFPEWEPVRDEKNILYLKRCQWSKDLERRISTMKARNTEEKRLLEVAERRLASWTSLYSKQVKDWIGNPEQAKKRPPVVATKSERNDDAAPVEVQGSKREFFEGDASLADDDGTQKKNKKRKQQEQGDGSNTKEKNENEESVVATSGSVASKQSQEVAQKQVQPKQQEATSSERGDQEAVPRESQSDDSSSAGSEKWASSPHDRGIYAQAEPTDTMMEWSDTHKQVLIYGDIERVKKLIHYKLLQSVCWIAKLGWPAAKIMRDKDLSEKDRWKLIETVSRSKGTGDIAGALLVLEQDFLGVLYQRRMHITGQNDLHAETVKALRDIIDWDATPFTKDEWSTFQGTETTDVYRQMYIGNVRADWIDRETRTIMEMPVPVDPPKGLFDDKPKARRPKTKVCEL